LKFNKFNAYNHIVDQLALGNRIPGTQPREDCANYFVTQFQAIDPGFSYALHNYTILGTACQNVLFKLNSQRTNIVILGAHYDSRAKATKDGSHPNDPVPGANDGASGSAVLIELARVLYDQKDNLECEIWFLFFDAEDQGVDSGGAGITGWDWCEGSWEFVDNIDTFYSSTTETFECMVLLDMVGGTGLKFINEQYSTSSLLDELFTTGQGLGYTNEFPASAEIASITDDHCAFVDIGIPSADLIINFWSNPNWPHHHKTTDTITYISRDSLEATGETVEQFVYNVWHKDSTYVSNYPWDVDNTTLPPELIIFLIGVAVVVSGSLIAIYYARQNALKRIIEADNLEKSKGNGPS